MRLGLGAGNKTLLVAVSLCLLGAPAAAEEPSSESPAGANSAAAKGSGTAEPPAQDAPRPDPQTLARGRTPPVPATMPQAYAVMTFENRSGVNGYDWMNAAVPFVLGEKLEAHADLRPAYGTLVVSGRAPNRVDGASVRAFADRRRAAWVWTGWIKRMPNWDLQLGISLWKRTGNTATRIAEIVGTGDFKDIHTLTGKAIDTLCTQAGIPLSAMARHTVHRAPTQDHYAFTLFGRGLAFFAGTLGWVDLTRAEKNFTRASYIDPEFAEAHRLLGELYQRTGRSRLARGRFDRALAKRPHYYAALAAQAAGERARGKLEPVLAMNTEMVHQRPWDLERRYHLGRVLWETGDIDRAMIELDRLVTMRPKDVRARRILVLIHATKGKLKDLVRALERVADLDPSHVPTKLDLAAAYAAADRTTEAISAYIEVLAMDTGNALALKFLGDLSLREGKRSQAARYYRRAMKANPRDPRPYFQLGAIYVEDGNDRKAKHIYRAAQRFKRYLGEASNNLGAISYREGNLHESLWYLRRALKLSPHNARVRYNLALTFSVFKQYEHALAHLEKGLELDPSYVELHYLHGVVMLRTGAADAARDAFGKVLALAPKHEDARHNLLLLDDMERRANSGEVLRQ